MHRLIVITLSFFLLAIHVGQANAQDGAQSAAVESAERAWADALVSKDISELESHLDDRFQLVNVGVSSAVERDEYLSQQSTPARAYRHMVPSNIRVTVNGRIAVAVLDMSVAWPEGMDAHTSWRFIDTWIWNGSRWRAVSRVGEPT